MIDLRRAFVCVLLACASCEGGPTSDWPTNGSPDDDKNGEESNNPPGLADAGTSTGVPMDGGSFRDGSVPIVGDQCAGDAGADAGDAGCESRDE